MEQLEDMDLVLVLLILFIYSSMQSRNGRASIQYRPPDVYPRFEYSLYDLPESTIQLWFR